MTSPILCFFANAPPQQLAAGHCCWVSVQAMLAVNRFWGIIHHGWTPMASFITSAVLFGTTGCCWLVMGRTGKRCLLVFQILLQLLYAVTAGLALVSYLLPAQLDAQVRLLLLLQQPECMFWQYMRSVPGVGKKLQQIEHHQSP